MRFKCWAALCAAIVFGCLTLVSTVSGGEPYFSKDYTEGMNIPDIVAKVNGVEMNSKFVKFEFNRVMNLFKGKVTQKQKIELARDIIDKEITRELLAQTGQAKSKKVSESRVEEELEKLKAGYPGEAEFQDALKQRGIDVAVLKKSIGTDIVSHELLEDRIRGKITISDEEIRKFYDDNKESFFRPQAYRAQHIFLRLYPEDLEQTALPGQLEARKKEYSAQALKRIRKIRDDLKNGSADFAGLAKQYSEDAGSAQRGGDLDFIYKGVFPPEFDAAISQLKPGETSDIVTTPFGYHIIKLNEIKPAEYAKFDEVKGSIQRHMFMEEAKKLVSDYLAGLKKQAKIEIYF